MKTLDLTKEVEVAFAQWAWSRRNLAKLRLIPDEGDEEMLKAVLLALPWAECPCCERLHIDAVVRIEAEYQGVCPECYDRIACVNWKDLPWHAGAGLPRGVLPRVFEPFSFPAPALAGNGLQG